MQKGFSYILQLLIFSLGGILLGLAVTCFIKSGIGIDPFSTFAQGLSNYLPWRVDEAILYFSYIMMSLTFFLDRKLLGLGSLLFPFVSAMSIQISMQVITEASVPTSYLLLAIGILCMAFSIAITAKTHCGKNPYDSVCFALLHQFNLTYTQVRWLVDGLLLCSGIIMGGTFGIGTIMILLVVGEIASRCMRVIDRFIIVNEKKEEISL